LIENGDAWMRIIQSRALTSHTYNEDTARKIASEILNEYYAQFIQLKDTLEALREKEDGHSVGYEDVHLSLLHSQKASYEIWPG
jgi:hypothetical protein